jgi:C4-dicarboxylate-binding protein DctP
MLSANVPLIRPDDLLGLKMRIQASRVIEAQMAALGALPQALAYSEAYSALQTGVVDGTENPASNMFTQKMYEVQRHATLTHHGYLGYAVIVNKDFWEGLPADIRAGLEQAVREATPIANEFARQENDEALAFIRKFGRTIIHEPTPEESRAWVEALLPVHKEMAGRVGAELIQRIYAETGVGQ